MKRHSRRGLTDRRGHQAKRQRPKFRFRIVFRRPRKSPEIVWMTNDRQYAIELAKQLEAQRSRCPTAKSTRTGDDIHPIRSVWVEHWSEESSQVLWDSWKTVWPTVDGKKTGQDSAVASGTARLPKSGDIADCVLLPSKTRRGGWKAKLAASGLIGPITNTNDVPSDARPNAQVALRVAVISKDGKHLQLVWP